MKTRLYLKKKYQNILIAIMFIAAMVTGGMVDNLNTPTSHLIAPLSIVLGISIVLIRFGKFED